MLSDDLWSASAMSPADSPTPNRFRSSVISVWVQRFSTMMYHSTARARSSHVSSPGLPSVNPRSPVRQLGSQPKEAYDGNMQLHGSTEGNLIAAVRSASRLRGHPVHADTIKHWADLLQHARKEISTSIGLPAPALPRLVAELEGEMARRPQ